MLFRTISELQPYISVTAGLSIQMLESHLANAAEEWVKPLLGEVLFNQLLDDFENESDNPNHLKLLGKCRAVVAPLGFLNYLPFGQVQVSDAGMRTIQTENHRAAYRWQIEKLEKQSQAQGFRQLENLAAFLEENVLVYTTWDYAKSHSHTINSATEFDEHVRINKSRLIYLNLLPEIKRAERNISRTTSKEQMKALKDAIATNSLTAPLEELLEHVRPAVAHLAYSKGIRALPLSFDGDKLSIYNNQFLSDFDPHSMPDPDLLAYLVRIHKEQAEQAEEALSKFLQENAIDYPEFISSDAYTPIEAPIDEDFGFEDTGFFFA